MLVLGSFCFFNLRLLNTRYLIVPVIRKLKQAGVVSRGNQDRILVHLKNNQQNVCKDDRRLASTKI